MRIQALVLLPKLLFFFNKISFETERRKKISFLLDSYLSPSLFSSLISSAHNLTSQQQTRWKEASERGSLGRLFVSGGWRKVFSHSISSSIGCSSSLLLVYMCSKFIHIDPLIHFFHSQKHKAGAPFKLLLIELYWRELASFSVLQFSSV